MSDFEYNRRAIIGDGPLNLNPLLRPDFVDGSIASQLDNAGWYRGVKVVYIALQEYFADQPEIQDQLRQFFIATDDSDSKE